MPSVSKVQHNERIVPGTARKLGQGGSRLPKGAITGAILRYLQEENKGVPRPRVAHAIKQRLPEAGEKGVYQALLRMIQSGAIATEERDGTTYLYAPGVLERSVTEPTRDQIPDLAEFSAEQPAPASRADLERDQAAYALEREQAAAAERKQQRDQQAALDLERARERQRILHAQLERERGDRPEVDRGTIEAAILAVCEEKPRPHTRTYLVTAVSSKLHDAPALAIHRSITDLLNQGRLESENQGGVVLISSLGVLRPAPAVEQAAPAPAPQPEPVALPDVPHFLDCHVVIAGLDIHARLSIDIPNSIEREATFKYLQRWIAQLERITQDVLSMGAMAAQLDQAMQLAQDEEQQRKALEEKLVAIRELLPALQVEQRESGHAEDL